MESVHYKGKTQNIVSAAALLLVAGFLFCSCQKEVAAPGSGAGGGGTTNQKPKVGTIWTYRYYTYYSTPGGGIATSTVLTLKAKSLDVLGGEQWLNIVDMVPDTTYFLLNEKPGGLYDYTNNSSYLFCKSPAAVNDTYNSYLSGMTETVVVKTTTDSLATGIGNIPVIYYEGSSGAYIYDKIWYNEYAWVVKRETYRRNPIAGIYYRYSTLALDNIVY